MGQFIEEIARGSGQGKLRAVFLDVDGTILNSRHEVTARTRQAVHELRDQGIKVGFASGRPYFSIAELAKELRITDPCMLFSGALICNPLSGEALYRAPISPALAKQALKLAAELQIHAEVYTAKEYFIDRLHPHVEMHKTYLKKDPIVTNLTTIIDREEIIKVELVMNRNEEEARFRAAMERFGNVIFGLGFGAAHPDIIFANIISTEADRVTALGKLCELYGITPDQCASFGDGEADLPFLTRVGFGVAMGNAPETVKTAAPFITKHVDDDGVAFALEHLF